MVKSLRTYSLRGLKTWDLLNAVDCIQRLQAFPLVLRDKFQFLFSQQSLTGLLRTKFADVKVICLSLVKDSLTKDLYRKVDIFANNHWQWRASTRIPNSSRLYLAQFFKLDQNFSIGDFLFFNANVKRKSIHVSIRLGDNEDLNQNRCIYWVRQSVWVINGKYEIWVTEFF